ncbi:MAG: hypothetical protein EOP61_02145 [Sphingomonadales bacterium]|nr:MAG: hypothetical protein EOP61_02145 [Sphingomonadales bacterium]
MDLPLPVPPQLTMDEAKRAQLHARREAILEEKRKEDFVRRRAEFVAMVPILTALEAAGDDYDSHDYRALPGAFNAWAHDPRRFAMREHSHEDLPADPAARNRAILARLRERFGPNDPVTIILRRESLVLKMRMPVLERHLDILFENAKADWLAFVAPPADWIIATYHVDEHRISQIVTGEVQEYPG